MLVRRLVLRSLLRQSAPPSARAKSTAQLVPSAFPDVDIPTDMAVHQKVFQNLPRWAHLTAVEDVVTDRKYSFNEVEDLSRRVGAGFLRSGLRQGQVVTVVLPNVPEFLIATLGALAAGLTVSTINPLYATEEILHQLRDSDTALVVTYPGKVGEVRAALEKLEGPRAPIAVVLEPGEQLPPGTRSFQELFSTPDTQILHKVEVSPDSVAFLLYSSGTTGLPKGVRLTHRNVLSNIAQVDSHDFLPNLPTTSEHQDVTACVLPFFHVYGLVIGALANLSQGVKLLTLPRFDKDLYIKALTAHKTTIVSVVPPIVQFLANHPEVKLSTLSSLRAVLNGAASLSQTDGNRLLEKKKDIYIASGYGLTESSPVITAPRRNLTDLDSVGYLLPNTQLKIIHSESGEIIDWSTPGEVCARGPQIMDGYHKNKEATDKTIIDGWLHTGDVGFIKGGRLFIVDRLKELIKVKGFQVAPMELEELLRSHPGVGDVGVVGKPHPKLGETPVAFVVPTKNKPTAQELKDFVASKVAEYKQISEVVFVQTIPKNLTGKILRRNLKEMLPKS